MILRFIPFIFCLAIFSSSSAHPAWGIVVDDNKNIYFADIGHNEMGSVWKLDAKGHLELLLRDFHAHNVSLDRNGNLVTAHGENNHTMIRIHQNGSRDTLIHTLDLDEFFGGNCTYGPNDNIYFGIGKHIWKIDSAGKKHRVTSKKLEWNQAVFVDKAGIVFAPDKAVDNGVVYRILPDGTMTIIARDLIAKLDRPKDKHNDVLLGMGKDQSGNLYIAESAGRRVIKILKDQQTEDFYTSAKGWIPTGIYFFENEAYILEFKTSGQKRGPQVVKLNTRGEKTILFNYDDYQKPIDPPKQGNSSNGTKPIFIWGMVVVLILFGLQKLLK